MAEHKHGPLAAGGIRNTTAPFLIHACGGPDVAIVQRHHKCRDAASSGAVSNTAAPFDCTLKVTGPVCTGERAFDTGWGAFDVPCDVPLHSRTVSHRSQARFYDHDNLNYDRTFRINDVDYLSTSPEGPADATITTRGRFTEPFAVPGDDSTFTVITTGTMLDVKPTHGPSLLRVVGTLVEPPDAEPTVTGHLTVDGATTRYDDVLLTSFFTEKLFIAKVCEAVTTGG